MIVEKSNTADALAIFFSPCFSLLLLRKVRLTLAISGCVLIFWGFCNVYTMGNGKPYKPEFASLHCYTNTRFLPVYSILDKSYLPQTLLVAFSVSCHPVYDAFSLWSLSAWLIKTNPPCFRITVLILMMIKILEEHFSACAEADTAVAGSVGVCPAFLIPEPFFLRGNASGCRATYFSLRYASVLTSFFSLVQGTEEKLLRN